mmetsp:Transcript_103021/g.245374  ORF Transcript_103021/g.245374 Transcript_103021/m.245374 type:complete len:229 (+) Transcript_103021:636-1322(+)
MELHLHLALALKRMLQTRMLRLEALQLRFERLGHLRRVRLRQRLRLQGALPGAHLALQREHLVLQRGDGQLVAGTGALGLRDLLLQLLHFVAQGGLQGPQVNCTAVRLLAGLLQAPDLDLQVRVAAHQTLAAPAGDEQLLLPGLLQGSLRLRQALQPLLCLLCRGLLQLQRHLQLRLQSFGLGLLAPPALLLCLSPFPGLIQRAFALLELLLQGGHLHLAGLLSAFGP